jgi:hypothetical protein
MVRFSTREAYLSADKPYHVVQVRKGKYRLVPLDEHIAVEPAELDLQEDGAMLELRWSSR